jgi:hypothetical protein
VLEAAQAGGDLPLDYMLRVMRDLTASAKRRDEMAKAAAPYLHSRLMSALPPEPQNVPAPVTLVVQFESPDPTRFPNIIATVIRNPSYVIGIGSGSGPLARVGSDTAPPSFNAWAGLPRRLSGHPGATPTSS